MTRPFSLAALALLLTALAGSAAGQRPALTILPLGLTVARAAGQPVVDRAWLTAQLREANAIFRPTGLAFRITVRRAMPEAHARMETRDDRHRLGLRMVSEVINWFAVLSLRDVDEPDRMRRGVHWRPRGSGVPAGAHIVIVSSISGPRVLAHELGHFFGNRHSTVRGNIMSYEQDESRPTFDRDQIRRVRQSARSFVESGELLPIPSGAPATPRR